MSIKINKLSINFNEKGYKQDKSGLSRTIISRDFFNQESKLPELFALIEIKKINGIGIESIYKLLDAIEWKIISRVQKIYNSINERKSFQTDNLSEHLLELILKSLNGEIKDILEEKDFISQSDINIFIGVLEPFVLKNEEKYYFHFAVFNNVKNILIYKQGDKYKLMDIIEENKKNNDEYAANKKMFENIISGELDNDSYIIVANQKVIDYVIPDKLKQLVISMNTKEAIKYLKKILTEINPNEENLSFSAMLISLTDEEVAKIFKPENSIKNLISTEKNTEKFLTPSILPDFKGFFITILKTTDNALKIFGKKIFALKNTILKIKHPAFLRGIESRDKNSKNSFILAARSQDIQKGDETNKSEEMKEKKEKLKSRFKSLLPRISRTAVSSAESNTQLSHQYRCNNLLSKCGSLRNIKYNKINNNIKKIFLFAFNYAKKIFKSVGKLICGFLFIFVYAFRKIKKISAMKIALIIIFIIAIAGFLKGTSFINKKKIDEQNKIIYNKSLKELEQKFDSLEANLIYNNYEKSSELLKEIKDVMRKTLAADIPEYKDQYNELEKKIVDYNKKINKINEIKNPFALKKNLSEINNIAITNNKLALISNSLNKIEIIDKKNEISEEWNITEENILANFKYFSSSEDDKILAYGENKNKPYELDLKNKKILPLTKTFFAGIVSDIKNYADNIYAIDTKNNQIYFYKYENGQKWIKDANVNLEGAINLAIDGNIFILKNNGEILKYFKGKKENFSLQGVEPALASPTAFFTDADAKYLYILEPLNKRILVFEKECKDAKCQLLAQYTSENFNDMRDFAVDETNKIIYVLNGNEIFKIDIK